MIAERVYGDLLNGIGGVAFGEDCARSTDPLKTESLTRVCISTRISNGPPSPCDCTLASILYACCLPPPHTARSIQSPRAGAASSN